VVDLMRQQAVADTVAREKTHPPAGDPAHDHRVGRRAERGGDGVFRDFPEAIHLIEPAAADDADRRLVEILGNHGRIVTPLMISRKAACDPRSGGLRTADAHGKPMRMR